MINNKIKRENSFYKFFEQFNLDYVFALCISLLHREPHLHIDVLLCIALLVVELPAHCFFSL